ncbi:hypothetical protein [Pantoea stewartii]|uniref:hypothetical protein n=1 Tax=Pantoea stewartii TaxID=66269 RepID=UPI003366C85C
MGEERFTGVIGSTRNGVMRVTSPSNNATFSADELIVTDPNNGRHYQLRGFKASIDITSINDENPTKNTLPENGFIAIYAIFDPEYYKSSYYIIDATNTIVPEVYDGSALPSGYTASALVSVWRISSGKLVVGFQNDREVNISRDLLLRTSVYSNTLFSQWNELDISSVIPPNASWIEVDIAGITGTKQHFYASGICGEVDSNRMPLYGVTWPTFVGTGQIPASFPLINKQKLYYLFTQGDGTFDGGVIYSKKYKF